MGKYRLSEKADGLERDYAKMTQAGMFYGDPPTFEQLKQNIIDLQELANSSTPSYQKILNAIVLSGSLRS